MKTYLILLLVCILCFCLLAGCSNTEFYGTDVRKEDEFNISYSLLNGTQTHAMDLEEAYTIDVSIESISGAVDVIVADSDGQELYRGNDADSASFKLTVPKTDKYIFTVSGIKAEGSVSFKVK